MCQGCWERYGSPAIDTQAVRKAVELIRDVFGFDDAGGGLHVVIDDWNLDDDSLADRYEGRDDEFTREQIDAEWLCLLALKLLTVEERASALAMHDGFIPGG